MTYKELRKAHPGVENIQAAAALVWHNKVDDMRIIGTDFREVSPHDTVRVLLDLPVRSWTNSNIFLASTPSV